MEEIPTKTEDKFSFIKELNAKKLEIDAALLEADRILSELKEVKAFETISGKTDAGQTKEKPKEETPEEYAAKLMSGKIEAE